MLILVPGWSQMPELFSRPDTPGYVQPALSLASDCRFSMPGSTEPFSSRPPGFPLYLAFFFKIFGEHYVLPILSLCLLGALTCFPAFLCGRFFGNSLTGHLAAGLIACNITAIANSPMLLSDTLYGFLVAWQLYFFTRFHFKREAKCFYFAMLIAGAATLIRPIGSAWLIPGAFLCLIQPEMSWKKRIITAACGCLFFLTVICPWMARNKLAGAGFSIDSNTGSMYHQNGAMLLSKLNGTSYETEKQKILKELDREFADHGKYPDVASREAYRVKKFKELIFQHPVPYFSLHFKPSVLLPDAPTLFELLGMTTANRGTLDVLHREGVVTAVKHYFGDKLPWLFVLIPFLLITGLTYLGCLVQLIFWLAKKEVYLIFFFLAFVEYFFFLPGPITVPRYQVPALPLMTVMAAMALPVVYKAMLEKLRKRNQPSA